MDCPALLWPLLLILWTTHISSLIPVGGVDQPFWQWELVVTWYDLDWDSSLASMHGISGPQECKCLTPSGRRVTSMHVGVGKAGLFIIVCMMSLSLHSLICKMGIMVKSTLWNCCQGNLSDFMGNAQSRYMVWTQKFSIYYKQVTTHNLYIFQWKADTKIKSIPPPIFFYFAN